MVVSCSECNVLFLMDGNDNIKMAKLYILCFDKLLDKIKVILFFIHLHDLFSIQIFISLLKYKLYHLKTTRVKIFNKLGIMYNVYNMVTIRIYIILQPSLKIGFLSFCLIASIFYNICTISNAYSNGTPTYILSTVIY